MNKSKIHIEKDDYTAIIQDNINNDIRITVFKKEYLLISMLFTDGNIVRQRSFEHNGVKVPKEAINVLKNAVVMVKDMFVDFKYLRVNDVDDYLN